MIKEQIRLHASLDPVGRKNPGKKRCQRCRNPHSNAVFLSRRDCFPKFSTASRVTGVRKLAEQHREKGKQRRCPSKTDVWVYWGFASADWRQKQFLLALTWGDPIIHDMLHHLKSAWKQS